MKLNTLRHSVSNKFFNKEAKLINGFPLNNITDKKDDYSTFSSLKESLLKHFHLNVETIHKNQSNDLEDSNIPFNIKVIGADAIIYFN